MGKAHPDTRKERTWYEHCSNDYCINVIIVEAPLTFGHSQLILRSNRDMAEEMMFNSASVVIKECMPIMRNKLPAAVEDNTWEKLRAYTKTSGRYIKTLVLKASADEKEKEYKVHLVPYFESHLSSTTLLFHRGSDVDESKTGGLFRWLGEQERRLDDQIEIWRNTCHFPSALVDSFELIKLADYLREMEVRR